MEASTNRLTRASDYEKKAWKRVRSALRNPITALGAGIVMIFVLTAIFAPWIAPFPKDAYGAPAGGTHFEPPAWQHLFGTDGLGRDMFSRVIVGARLSLEIIGLGVVSAATIGTTIGLLAGYASRWIDEALMRLTDIFLSLPSLVLAMLIAITLHASILSTIAAIALTYWPRYARLARGEVLRYRSQPFVEAALVLGASSDRIIRKHLLPNILPTIMVQASLDSGATLLTASALGFVGLGAQPPSPEWGLMVSVGRSFMPQYWWLSAFPGLAIFVVVIGLNLLGDGLRSFLNPRTQGL